MERLAGPALMLGALGFLAFWVSGLFGLFRQIPWALTLGLHGLSVLLVAAGVIGLQLDRRPRADLLGWSVAAFLVIMLPISMELLMVSFIAYGIVWWMIHRAVAAMLVAGGVVFLATLAGSAPFWNEGDPDPHGVFLVGYAVGLVLVAAGLVQLGFSEYRRRQGLRTA